MSFSRAALVGILVITTPSFAEDAANPLESFVQAVPVQFVNAYDPGYVELQYEDGTKIDGRYEGIDFEVLFAWEEDVKKTGVRRPMTLCYTLRHGVVVTDDKTKKTFRLPGKVTGHPIDFAIDAYQAKHKHTTHAMRVSLDQAARAWDAELNRIYKALGGKENKPLRDAQRAWIAYRDAQVRFLVEEYGKRDGTLWPVICAKHIMSVTRSQAQLLQRTYDGWS